MDNGNVAPEGFTLDRIAEACASVGISDSKFESLSIELLYGAPPEDQAPALAIPEGWRLVEKATHYQLIDGNTVVASLAGPDAEANAAIIARALAAPQQHAQAAQAEINDALDRADAEDAARFGAQAALSDEPQGCIFAHPDSQKLQPLVAAWFRDRFADNGESWRAITQYVLTLSRAQQKITWDTARAILATRQPAPVVAAPTVAAPELTVFYGAMPESNGKSNFTATLMRKGASLFDTNQYTFSQSEYPDRVRYDADSMRYLIGELEVAPDLHDYDGDKHSSYVEPQPAAAPVAAAVSPTVDSEVFVQAMKSTQADPTCASCHGAGVIGTPGEICPMCSTPQAIRLREAIAAAEPPADAAPSPEQAETDGHNYWGQRKDDFFGLMSEREIVIECFKHLYAKYGAAADAAAVQCYICELPLNGYQQGRASGIEEAAKLLDGMSELMQSPAGRRLIPKAAAAIRALNK